MKFVLRYSGGSPFARKVRVAAHELGLARMIEEIPSHPWKAPDDLKILNPLGKIPTLVTEDGTTIFDSPVICEYLDTLHDRPKLIPPSGPARWRALRTQALGDGIMDAAVLWRIEITQRKEHGTSPEWVERQQGAIFRALDELKNDPAALAGPMDRRRDRGSLRARLSRFPFRIPELAGDATQARRLACRVRATTVLARDRSRECGVISRWARAGRTASPWPRARRRRR